MSRSPTRPEHGLGPAYRAAGEQRLIAPLRLLIAAACLGFIALAIGSGLDRQTARTPAMAAGVPALFATEALAFRGEARIASHDGPGAAALGEALVARAPIDPASTALLGAGRLLSGDEAGAARAFRVAGQLGWRVPLTQRYWLAQSLALGDLPIAAQRLDALLRQQPALLQDRALLDRFERTAEGRAVMVSRLALRPDWLDRYATDVEGTTPEVMQLRAGVLTALAARGVQMGCDRIAAAVRRLAGTGAVVQASGLWHGHCADVTSPAGGQALADGHFSQARIDQLRTPFDWQFTGSSDIDLRLQPARGGQHLLIALSGAQGTTTLPRAIASQMIVAPPGAYRLSWQSSGESGDVHLLAALSCAREPAGWLPARRDAANALASVDVVIDAACAGHWLVLALQTSAHAGPVQVRLDDVALEPVASGRK